ncbi:MAG TPA: hypothetical protein VHI93_05800, partial [Candidatus Thermoplasmatota archaeon]|nr:hypothetical protein [Candidatus Thermoplasmatota archaeon]
VLAVSGSANALIIKDVGPHYGACVDTRAGCENDSMVSAFVEESVGNVHTYVCLAATFADLTC